jgi:hypothetical protein
LVSLVVGGRTLQWCPPFYFCQLCFYAPKSRFLLVNRAESAFLAIGFNPDEWERICYVLANVANPPAHRNFRIGMEISTFAMLQGEKSQKEGSPFAGREKIFEDLHCKPNQFWYCASVKTKMPFPMRNKKAVPSQLERVTNQWQPARTGGTAQQRVTDELTYVKDRKCRGFLPAQNSSENQAGRAMVGPARISCRKPGCGDSDGGRGNYSQAGKAGTMNTNVENLGDFFGEPIAAYTRRQAIEDGVLVDLMQPETVGIVREAGFKFPMAMTAGAFAATVAALANHCRKARTSKAGFGTCSGCCPVLSEPQTAPTGSPSALVYGTAGGGTRSSCGHRAGRG